MQNANSAVKWSGVTEVTKFRPSSCRLCGWLGAEGLCRDLSDLLPARQFFQLPSPSCVVCCGCDFVVSVRGRELLFTLTKVKFLVVVICRSARPDNFKDFTFLS